MDYDQFDADYVRLYFCIDLVYDHLNDVYISILNRTRDRTNRTQNSKSELIQFLEIIQIKMIHH